ncbi:MAG: GNAT family N-acetyltransferase [Leptolyngbyaceae cyanobacterium SM2_5_2]|nr:GNAT family N-acetyltransferase [Leptolyngbyaceae cyanobacterium SM2_5_2]
MSVYLHTQRLRLEPCQIGNLDAIHRLWMDADIRQFLFDDRIIALEEAQSFLEASAESFSQHGYGLWLMFEQQSPDIAGFSGLLAGSEAAPSLIFGTRPQLWGRGYAKEAARAILAYAFDELGLACVLADVNEPNQASIRVLEALGMSCCRRAMVNGRPLLYYEIYA